MMTREQQVKVIGGTAGVLIVAAMLLAAVVDAAAQGRAGRGRGGPGGFISDAGGRGGGIGRLLRLDSLSDAQRQQIRTLVDERRESLAMLAREAGEARRALAASAQSGQVDESKATDLGNATSALALARARLQADVFAVLTAEQKAELEKRRDAMRAWREARPDGAGRAGPGRRGGQPR
jgi:Spy/CpxP family protein refolding chaperone